MKKFTIFTVILTIIIVVVVADILVNDYLPNLTNSYEDNELKLDLPDSLNIPKNIQVSTITRDQESDEEDKKDTIPDEKIAKNVTEEEPESETESTILANRNLLGADVVSFQQPVATNITDIVSNFSFGGDNVIEEEEKNNTENLLENKTDNVIEKRDDGLVDFESFNFVSNKIDVYLREEHIRSAGFANSFLEKENFDGKLFKTVDIRDINYIDIDQYLIRTEDTMLAKVYIFKIDFNSNINEVYENLKIKASNVIDTHINETNEFGKGSFYTNDGRRPSVAFLTIKIGEVIYSFSYPKDYHSQIKNLIQLLQWEFQ